MIRFVKKASRRAYALVDEYFFLPFFGIIPRFIFGNNAGFFNNISALLELKVMQYVAPCKLALSEESKRAAQLLKENGLLKLAPCYAPAFLDGLQQRVNYFFEQKKNEVAFLGEPPYRDAHIMLKNPLRVLPELSQLLSEEVKEILYGYYGTSFYVSQLRCWRNAHVPHIDTQANVFSNQWHNDQFNTNELKFFVYLTNGVNEETGAFRAFDIPYTKKIMRVFGFFRRSHIFGKAADLINDQARVCIMNGDLGTAFFACAPKALHRAGIPQAGSYRDIVQICIRPTRVPFATNWSKAVIEDALDSY